MKNILEPFVELDWMKELEISIQAKQTFISQFPENDEPKTEKLDNRMRENFKTLFQTKHTIESIEVSVDIKPGTQEKCYTKQDQ